MKNITVGARVVALAAIIEDDASPDPDAARCEAGFVHAFRGEVGVVEDVAIFPSQGPSGEETEVMLMVRFERTGTMMMCLMDEVGLAEATQITLH